MKFGIIYRATSPSGKVYVGKTIKTIDNRRIQHCSNAYNTKHSAYNTKFYRAIRKYGSKSFVWGVVENNIVEEFLGYAERLEIKRLDSYKSGYNSTLGGEGCLGLKHSDAVKKKISKSSSERNSGSGNPRYGKEVSRETRLKISKANKGKVSPIKGKKFNRHEKIKIALKRGQKVFIVYDLSGEYIGEWLIATECAEELNIDNSTINKCLRGIRKSHKGYIFKYKESK